MVCAFSGVFRNNLTSLATRHKLHTLLDLWLRSYQEEEEDTMDHACRGRLPVDAFHHPCVPRLYRAYVLPSPTTNPHLS